MSSTWEEEGQRHVGNESEERRTRQAQGTRLSTPRWFASRPKKGDSGPRLWSGTAPDRLQEEEITLQAWCDKQDNTAACTEHQQAGWGRE